MSIVLGVDLATADVRVRAIDVETGACLAEHRRPLAVTSTHDRHSTQAPLYGVIALDLIAAVAHDLGDRAGEVQALSVTGTSGTVVPVDERGAPVGDAVLYDDSRGAVEQQQLAAAGFTARPVAALARAAWMHRVDPHARLVYTPDVVIAALAGRLLPSDTSHALKSGIDPVSAQWDDAALASVGVPREALPDLVSPGRALGELADPAALGLPAGVLIVSGMTDGSTGQIATGAAGEGDTVGILGTTLVLKAVSRINVASAAEGIYSHVAPDGLCLPGGASNSGAGVLRTGITAGLDPAMHTAFIAECGPSDLVSYPLARPGERFPLSRRDFTGFSVDLSGRTSETDDPIVRFRSVYEGVAFVERLGLERLSELGVVQKRHHVAGGTAASALWNQIRASALGRHVVVTSGAGSAQGAAVIAASVLGSDSLASLAERFSGSRTIVDPDPTLTAALEERYRVFRAALALRSE